MNTDSTLRIRGVETHPVLVPMSRPVRTATGTIAEATLLLIDLHAEEGVTGRAPPLLREPRQGGNGAVRAHQRPG